MWGHETRNTDNGMEDEMKQEEKDSGLHRKSAQAGNSNPAQAAGGSFQGTSLTTASLTAAQQAAYARAISQTNAIQQAAVQLQLAQLQPPITGGIHYFPSIPMYQGPTSVYSLGYNVEQETAYKDIKYDGIIAGEIIAYRCWPIQHGFLYSTAAGRAWAPDEPMAAAEGHLESGLGIYAFKNMSRVIENFRHVSVGEGVAFGTVELWGEIVEHEIGYRAQFAKIRSIEFVKESAIDAVICDNLRKLYKVENPGEGTVTKSIRDESGAND